MLNKITEGKAIIKAPEGKISKKLVVFYNPIMKTNRDISILLLNTINQKGMRIASPLAGTGIRGIRFLQELNKGIIDSITFNDINPKATSLITENLKLNKIKNKNIIIKNEDANLFLLNSTGFDYIDIDPFGTPNPFLDAAVKRISRKGILAITATDTAPLAGTIPKACIRKYWAVPLKTDTMHEIGLRILIRKIQLVAAQYDKALTPIFSYFKDHYLRTILKVEKGKSSVDKILKQHGLYQNAGPLWLGTLWDKTLVMEIYQNLIEDEKLSYLKKDKGLLSFIKTIKEEAKIDTIGFYKIPSITKKYKLKTTPKKEALILKIREKGFKASSTHFDGESIRTDIPEKELLKRIKSIKTN